MEQGLHTEESVLDDTVIEETETTEEIVEQPVTETAKEPESVEDSVRKAIEGEKAKQGEAEVNGNPTEGQGEASDGLDAKSEGKTEPELAKKKGKREVIPDLGDVQLDPPARLSQAEKQVFSKLPNHLKPAVARMFKEHEAHFSRTQAEYSKALNEAKHIVEAVRPYYTSVPEFAQKGITESHLVTTLIGTHQALLNPKTSKSKLAEVASSLGHRIRFIDEDGDDVSDDSVDEIENHPKFRALQERLDRVDSHIRTQTRNQTAAPIIAEIQKVQQEVDANGNLLYPELQDQRWVASVRSLVSARVGNDPDPAAWARALVDEVYVHRRRNGNPDSFNQTKPPQNNTNTRAVTAARTVRGGVTPSAATKLAEETAVPGQSMEDSVRAAIERIKRGVN